MRDGRPGDQRVHDPGLPAVPPSVGDDLCERPGYRIVYREWVKGAFDPRQSPEPTSPYPLASSEENPHVEFSESHDGDRSFVWERSCLSLLLLADEHRGVEQPPHSSAVVDPRTAWTSSTNPGSRESSTRIDSNSERGTNHLAFETGTRSATGRPRTVTRRLRPAATCWSTFPMSFRSSLCGISLSGLTML